MASSVVAVDADTQLKEALENLDRIASRCEHHTVIPAAINILPVEPSLDQHIENVEMALEASPVQRVGLHVFVIAQYDMAVFCFELEVGLGGSLGKQKTAMLYWAITKT